MKPSNGREHLRIFILTGLSGSGKSTALDALEDVGFYCVDNMPVALLPIFLEMPIESDAEIAGLAFVMDLREKGLLTTYPSVFDELKAKQYRFELLFFEADETVLLQRFSQTRRHHPLSRDEGRGLPAAIRMEKSRLTALRKEADRVLDTSRHNVHELKAEIQELVKKDNALSPLQISLISFGFKYGIPRDSDLIMDVRFLTNPYFVPELKDLDGESEKIREYVMNRSETSEFFNRFTSLLDYLIPLYQREGKAYLTIAVGCTGGRHRSVVIIRALHEHLNRPGIHLEIRHRDIDRKKGDL